MPELLVPRSAITGLLLGCTTAFALALAPAASALPAEGPEQLMPVPGAQDPEEPPVEPGGGDDDGGGGLLELPEGLLCEFLGVCGDAPEEPGAEEPGAAEDGAEEGVQEPSSGDCDWVHTPFGKIQICDDEPPPPPENCRYLLGHDGNWTLECEDDTPPPIDCADEAGHGHPDCPPGEFDPCEDPEDGPTPVGCEKPGDTPREGGKPGLPLTGPSAVLALAALGGMLAAGGCATALLARRRRDENGAFDDGDPSSAGA